MLAGCGGGDDGGKDAHQAPDYVDQTLQGQINGKPWTFASGRITKPRPDETSQRWDVSMLSDARENLCDEFQVRSTNELDVIFSVPALAVARTDMGFGESGQTVTLVDGSLEIPLNTIAVAGFVEFTAVGAATVEGKMVADGDDDDVVNGKFSLTKCCSKDGSAFDYEICKE